MFHVKHPPPRATARQRVRHTRHPGPVGWHPVSMFHVKRPERDSELAIRVDTREAHRIRAPEAANR